MLLVLNIEINVSSTYILEWERSFFSNLLMSVQVQEWPMPAPAAQHTRLDIPWTGHPPMAGPLTHTQHSLRL